MRIILACMEHDYGDVTRGRSYEYYNFYCPLKSAGHDVVLFDYMAQTRQADKAGMNRKLLEMVQRSRPDLVLFSLYTDQFEPEVIDQLRTFTKTFCFFHDDTWRVEFSRFWARHFDFFSTPDIYGVEKYAAIGLSNAIYFPFGCNLDLFKKIDIAKQYDVSFVGAWHPYREWLVKRLRSAGFSVKTAGYRWPEGIVDHEQMVRIFNESRINLNMSNSASWDARYLLSSPRALLNRLRSPKTIEQLKARHFEISGCGAFQLSYYVEGLEANYAIGREIGIYIGSDDLLAKVEYYLTHEDARAAVAQAGLQRTVTDHSYAARFGRIFHQMGLSS